MEMAVNKIMLASVLALLACSPRPIAQEPIPVSVAVFVAPPIYQVWAQRAVTCAAVLEKNADSTGAPFHVIHETIDVSQFVWIAILTEEPDGTFPCHGGRCFGRFVEPDSIFVSGQRVNDPATIGHEVLHYAVESQGEASNKHGPPWGLCEYITPAP